MKSIRVHQFGGPEAMVLEDLPEPRPAAGQVLIALKAIGVNPVDTYIRAGKYGPRVFPYTPGTDGAGIVEAVGEGVKSFRAGDRVYMNASVSGAYAEKVLCNESQVHRLPEKVTFEQGAALGVPYATAHRALYRRGHAKAGETVLVHGASGGVGVATVQFTVATGLTVIGTAGTDAGLDLVAKQGAHHVLNHHDPKYLEQIMALTGGKGVDLIIEFAAHINLGKDLPLLAREGRVVVVGSRGPVEMTPRDTMSRDADIRGMTLMNADEHELRGIHAAIIAGLENGSLHPIVGRKFPLAQAAKSHEAVLEAGSYGKIVLLPG